MMCFCRQVEIDHKSDLHELTRDNSVLGPIERKADLERPIERKTDLACPYSLLNPHSMEVSAPIVSCDTGVVVRAMAEQPPPACLPTSDCKRPNKEVAAAVTAQPNHLLR